MDRRMDRYYRAEKTRNLPVFRAFQQTYAGAIDFFFFLNQVALRTWNIYSSFSLSSAREIKPKERSLVHVICLNLRPCSLEMAYFPVFVAGLCPISSGPSEQGLPVWKFLCGAILFVDTECAGCNKNSCPILKWLLSLLISVSLW